MYGYAISKRAAAVSENQLRLSPGVLYPPLASLEKGGLITSLWEVIRADRGEAETDPEPAERDKSAMEIAYVAGAPLARCGHKCGTGVRHRSRHSPSSWALRGRHSQGAGT